MKRQLLTFSVNSSLQDLNADVETSIVDSTDTPTNTTAHLTTKLPVELRYPKIILLLLGLRFRRSKVFAMNR